MWGWRQSGGEVHVAAVFTADKVPAAATGDLGTVMAGKCEEDTEGGV